MTIAGLLHDYHDDSWTIIIGVIILVTLVVNIIIIVVIIIFWEVYISSVAAGTNGDAKDAWP